MTRGRVLQKFLPDLIRKVSGEGVEAGLAVQSKSLQSKKAKIEWQGVDKGPRRIWGIQA